jgi:hypothetical protein
MHAIISRIITTFPEMEQIRTDILAANTPYSFGVIKDALYVKMHENTTRSDRLQVSNSILALIEDQNMNLMDLINAAEDTASNM